MFQWWSGTLLHTYLALAAVARVLGVRVVIEFHEVLDTGEAKVPVARVYVRCLAPLLMRLSHAFVIHSQYDRPDLESRYRLGTRPVAIIPHGPFENAFEKVEAGGHTARNPRTGAVVKVKEELRAQVPRGC